MLPLDCTPLQLLCFSNHPHRGVGGPSATLSLPHIHPVWQAMPGHRSCRHENSGRFHDATGFLPELGGTAVGIRGARASLGVSSWGFWEGPAAPVILPGTPA